MEQKNVHESRKDLQFIVNDGIIYNKRDIMTLLWDLGFIVYFEVDAERVLNKGRGFIMRVSMNNEEPTLFLNGRVYLNVNTFDYMRVKKVKESMTLYELHSENRIIKIIPDTKKQQSPQFKYVADAMAGLGAMAEEEFPVENLDDSSDDLSDDWWKN